MAGAVVAGGGHGRDRVAGGGVARVRAARRDHVREPRSSASPTAMRRSKRRSTSPAGPIASRRGSPSSHRRHRGVRLGRAAARRGRRASRSRRDRALRLHSRCWAVSPRPNTRWSRSATRSGVSRSSGSRGGSCSRGRRGRAGGRARPLAGGALIAVAFAAIAALVVWAPGVVAGLAMQFAATAVLVAGVTLLYRRSD